MLSVFRSGNWRRFLIGLFAVQLAVASLVPHGYMLDVTGGQNTIIICTTEGMVEIPDPTLPESEEPEQQVCSFAVSAQPVLAVADAIFLINKPALETSRPALGSSNLTTRRHTPAQPRAPPLT